MWTKIIKIFLGILFVISFIGCSNRQPLSVKVLQGHGMDALILDNNTKVAYVKDKNDTYRFCASRESDVEKTSSDGFMLGLSGLTNGEKFGEEATDGALSLGGRSPIVLVTREFMYRACELSMNLNTNKDDTIKIYQMFLDSIKNISATEHDIGSKSNSALPKNIMKVNVDDDKVSSDSDDDEENDEDEDEDE